MFHRRTRPKCCKMGDGPLIGSTIEQRNNQLVAAWAAKLEIPSVHGSSAAPMGTKMRTGNYHLGGGRGSRDGMGWGKKRGRERGTGKGDSRGPEGLPPGVGVVGSGFSPQPRCFCAAHPRTHPLFSLRRFASRRHHPSPPLLIHTRPPLPTLNFVAFPSSNPRISSHHACHRNAIASSFLSPTVSQAPRRSDMRRAQRACDRCRIAPYPTPARRISRPGARKHSPESGACSPAVADL